MEKSIVSLETPVALKGLTIIPVAKVSISYSFAAGISIVSTKQPVAVIVISTSGKKAFRITGEEVPLVQLLEEYPPIRKSLEEV